MTDSFEAKAPPADSFLLTRQEAAGYCRVGLRTFDRRVAPHVRRLSIGTRRLFDTWLETQKDGRFTEIRGRKPIRSDSGPVGDVVIDPLARQIARRLKKKLLESSER